ncbi:Enhanced ethylene response protein 5 [Chlorella vulgaris]
MERFVREFHDAVVSEDGARLRHLVWLLCPGAQQAAAQARQANPTWNPALFASRLPAGWAEFLTLHCACLAAVQQGAHVEAYDKLVAALQHFLKVFREAPGAWVVGPMYSLVHNLSSVAQAADQELRLAGQRPDKLGDCGDQLRKCFAVSLQAPGKVCTWPVVAVPHGLTHMVLRAACTGARQPLQGTNMVQHTATSCLGAGHREKKLAALDIVNASIKIYFRLNTLRLCKNLMRTVESRQFAAFDSFPMSQRVTYQFYSGRLAVFDENYEQARQSLGFALAHCHKQAKKNKALVLKYLVPYDPIVAAMRNGDVKVFDDAMSTQQFLFIQEGTYLLLEKLRHAVYRRLLRKVHAVHAVLEPEKRTQVPLAQFQAALAIQGVVMSLDEVECVTANLIFKRYVKAYISHDRKIIVLAKKEPFPPLHMIVDV